MWKMLLLLWSVPLILGLVALARAAKGRSPLSESSLWLGAAGETRLTVWMWIKFALLAFVFFAIGLVEGAILLNFDPVWFVPAALLTATAAILLLVLWVRSAPFHNRVRQRLGWNQAIDIVSRKLSSYRAQKRPQNSRTLTKRYGGPDF